MYQTVLSDTREIRSLKPRLDRGEARPLSFSKEVVGLLGLYSRSLLTMLHQGEARPLSFSKECQSLWWYSPINNHHGSIPAQGIAVSASVSRSLLPKIIGLFCLYTRNFAYICCQRSRGQSRLCMRRFPPLSWRTPLPRWSTASPLERRRHTSGLPVLVGLFCPNNRSLLPIYQVSFDTDALPQHCRPRDRDSY